jgi:hypothetical protein
LREGGRLAVSRGFTIEDGPLFLKLQRQGEAFSAWYSRDGRRWVELGGINATFAEQVEVGVIAVNSSGQTLSAELEMLDIEDPRGSMARDDAGRGPDGPPRPPPPSTEVPQARPRRTSMLFEPGPRRKPPARPPAPATTEATGFRW